jgi:hypothetical protein
LEDYNLPTSVNELQKMAQGGRDRDDRNSLQIILEWKTIKAYVSSFESSDFEPILQTLRKLIDAGADINHQDRYKKSAAHYLTEWRILKEKAKVRMNQSHIFFSIKKLFFKKQPQGEGGQYRRIFFPKNSGILGIEGDIGTFGNMGTEIDFSFKNDKSVGGRHDVSISKVFQFYKEFYDRLK